MILQMESYRESGRGLHHKIQLNCGNVDIRVNIVQHIMWELWAKNAFALKIAPPAGHFWYVSHRDNSIAPL